MAQRKVALEFKDCELTRPMLNEIVGAQMLTNRDAVEIIVRCRRATKPARDAANQYPIKVTIVER